MKINTLHVSESIPPPSLPLPSLPSSREKEMQVQINNLFLKIEKIGKFVIDSVKINKNEWNGNFLMV